MKKIIDENGRLFGKISLLDIAVLLIVALLLVAAFVKFNVMEPTATTVKTVPVRYELTVRGIRDANAELYTEGTQVWTADTGTYIGKVVSKTVSPAKQETQLTNGRYVLGSVEGRVDMTLTLEADCTITNGRYYADRTFEINVGREHKLVTKYSQVMAYISGLDKEYVEG
jgi:hypothetical protein